MAIILLIRHGLTDYVTSNRAAGHTAGIHLNDEGRAQAAALAQRLRRLPIKAIYCSPLERTWETAEALSAAVGAPLQARPGLIETDTGEWTGRYYKDIQVDDAAVWQALQSHPKGTRIPGGETIDEIQTRMVAEIEAIYQAHRHDMVAIVSHADPIKAAIAHYIGLDLDHFQKLVIGPASVSAIRRDEHSAALLVMNHSGDLPPLAPEHGHRQAVRRITWPEEGKTMPRTIYDLRSVSRLTASAIGVPGERTFYIQAHEADSGRIFTLLCEKEQIAALALGIEQLLEEVEARQPASAPTAPVPDADLELEEPLEPVFRVGQLGLGYDQQADALVLVAYELPESEDVDPDTLSVARIWGSRSQMRALSRHAAAVVAAGRPLCQLCGEPMDASGHICPKKNGHKKIEIR